MKTFLSAFLLLLFVISGARADLMLDLDGEVVSEPICFQVRNNALHMIYGNFATNYYMHPEYNTKSRHRSNFRLEAAGSIDDEGYPADIAEFCSYGPFFEGRRLELVLRTLVPVFSCYTRIDAGPLVIKSRRNEDDTGNIMWAECYE